MEDQSRPPDVKMDSPKAPDKSDVPTTGGSDSGAKP